MIEAKTKLVRGFGHRFGGRLKRVLAESPRAPARPDEWALWLQYGLQARFDRPIPLCAVVDWIAGTGYASDRDVERVAELLLVDAGWLGDEPE